MGSMFLHTWSPSPLLFSLGGFELRWYGVLLALGALAGFGLMQYLGRRKNFREVDLIDLFIWLTIAGFLGGRVYHVLNELPYYLNHPTQIWMVWEGGLGIHGAMMAGLAMLILFARRKKLEVWALLDVLTPALALGQVIGRWGNYFNQELFGRPTAWPWGIPIDLPNRPIQYLTSEFFHPTFLYESLGNLVIVGLLIWLGRKRGLPPGVIALTYFTLYAILRITTESFRLDQTPIIGGLRLPILVSGVMMVAAITLLIRRLHYTSHV